MRPSPGRMLVKAAPREMLHRCTLEGDVPQQSQLYVLYLANLSCDSFCLSYTDSFIDSSYVKDRRTEKPQTSTHGPAGDLPRSRFRLRSIPTPAPGTLAALLPDVLTYRT